MVEHVLCVPWWKAAYGMENIQHIITAVAAIITTLAMCIAAQNPINAAGVVNNDCDRH